MVKTPSFYYKGPDSIPGQETKTTLAAAQPKEDNNDDGDGDDDICKGPMVNRRITSNPVWYRDSCLRGLQLYPTLFHIIVHVNSFWRFFSEKSQIMC